VMNINNEPEYIHQLYGTTPGKASFANNCLLARKLVEQGVRYVQLFDWGWDSHGAAESESLDYGFLNKCTSVDRAMTALIMDLKQRGLLDETLVVWGGEFGRTPMQENRDGKKMEFIGRDHHTEAFTMWMAGGGIKQGVSWGETDEIGYYPVTGKVSLHDVQATILNQMGFDHEKFTYQFQGRPFRLTDVAGKVINEIIA
jgi:arylsulfatase A-like enzyme